jgi:hypothetical protein
MKDNPTQTDTLDNQTQEESIIDAGDKQVEQKPQAWYDRLDGDLKSNPSITKFKSEADMAKSYIELQKTLGKDKVVVPTEKSTPEEWKAFFKKAGMPEADTEYDTNEEDLPEMVRSRDESLAEFRKQAHAAGVSKKQFDAMFKTYKKITNDRITQETEKLKGLKGETENALRSEWGAAYEGKVEAAQRVVNTFFKDKGIRPEFSILANDTGFIKAMAEIADKFGEDVISGKPRVTLTPSEATSEMNAMLMNKKGALYNELDPEHDAAVQKFQDLQAQALSGQ